MAIINLSGVNQADNVTVEWSVNPGNAAELNNLRVVYDIPTNGGIETQIPYGSAAVVGTVAQCRSRQRDICTCIILDPRLLNGVISVTITVKAGTATVATLTGSAGPTSAANSSVIEERLRFL